MQPPYLPALPAKTRSRRLVAALFSFVSYTACGSAFIQSRIVAPPRVSEDNRAYVAELIERAHEKRLWRAAQWLKLGHWQSAERAPETPASYTSQADGSAFFLAPDGKTNPEAELEATVRGFFSDPVPEPPEASSAKKRKALEESAKLLEHPVCRFPARLAWLSQELGMDLSRLKVTACPRFETFWKELQARSVTLVFSSYYLNNPASAFGHTFLRINKAPPGSTGKRAELLDYGIDFSADVDTNNAVIYAVKGVFGWFPGTLKRVPYYFKVREYNDFESRDLWEYELNLPPAKLAMLVAHLWELGHTYFDYYYVSENCSYQLLTMLEAADPSLKLTESLDSPVVPADTIGVLYANPGLVRNVRYRPSLRSQFKKRVEGLSGEQQSIVDALVYDPDASLPSTWSRDDRVRVFDAALDLLEIRYGKGLVYKTDAAAGKKKQRLLERRAAILTPSDELKVDPPWSKMPQRGFGSKRAGVGFGIDDGNTSFVSLDFRAALHDLADPSDGYPDLAQIEFLPARLRVFVDPGREQKRVELEDFSLVRVISLTPQSRFDRQLSWKVDLGATTVHDSACLGCLAGKLVVGGGAAASFFRDALAFFATADVQVLFSPDLKGLEQTPFRVGIGPWGGIRLRMHPRLVLLTTARWYWLPDQHPSGSYQVDGVIRWGAFTNFALSFEARARNTAVEGQLLSLVYF